METQLHGWTLSEVASLVGGEFSGPADLRLTRPVPAGYNDPHGITFAESPRYLELCVGSNVGAVIVPPGTSIEKPCVFVRSPRAAFGVLLAAMVRTPTVPVGVHPTAIVSPTARVHETACIGAYAVVDENAEIGESCVLYPFTFVGENSRLGVHCVLHPHVVVYHDVTLGERCRVHSGAVIGADGFGFVWTGDRQYKVPQVGGVVIGDDVEIGANTCIDRATCGETIVGNGTKLDNLVQVGHNVKVGSDTVIAAGVGIGGSSTIGDRVTIGGQASLSDHVDISDDVVLGGRSAAFRDIESAGEYFGLPPLPVSAAMRVMALQNRLPELFRRLKELESQVEALKRNE